MSRFDKTYCSQCGGEFGPGDKGYSHCEDHPRTRDSDTDPLMSLAYQLTNQLVAEYGLKNGNPIYRALRKMADAAEDQGRATATRSERS